MRESYEGEYEDVAQEFAREARWQRDLKARCDYPAPCGCPLCEPEEDER